MTSLPGLLRNLILTVIILLIAGGVTALNGQDQEASEEVIESGAPNLYLDCGRCYENYLRSNLTFVNFVRDQSDADIHLLITQAGTGSGGTEYTLKFLGRGDYEGIADTLIYASAQSDTNDDERRGLLRYIKLGMAPYITNSPLIQYANFDIIREEGDDSPQQQEDDWNYWVFDANANFEISGESQRNSLQLSGRFDATRITEDWKIELETEYDYERDRFELDDGDNFSSIATGKSFDGLAVKSITDHWSAGLSGGISSSTFSNINMEISASPALEYNFFPYREYNRRELVVQYRLSPTYQSYNDTTIYNKTEEMLLQEELSIGLDITETWGSINASLEGSHYFHDLTKNRLEFRTWIDFRITRGLSLRLQGDYSLINDQITLPGGDLTPEEIILRRRELATNYSYGFEIGISYTFGSIYNNIVNPRFGGGRRF